jgi:GT2 family glycosyltransferase
MMPDSGPRLSVVVPTCRRNVQLDSCLRRLAPGTQTLDPERYQVIVTDDGAPEDAEEMVRTRFPWARWVEGPRRGPAANRNAGARRATGEWIAFVDDDCLPDPDWLAAIERQSREPATDAIEGITVCPDKSDNPLEEHVENLDGGALWSCNLAVRRAVFEQLGGFDEDYTEACFEDVDLRWRLQRSGASLRFCTDVLVIHPTRVGTWRDLWRRTLRLRWTVLFRLKTGASTGAGGEACLNLLRITARAVRDRQPALWKRRAFTVAWQWLTFPVVLPYLLFWQHRFRQLLEGRRG